MAKKIHPKDQTEELNRVKLECLKRNPEEWQKLEDLLRENEKKRGEFLDNLSAISLICDGDTRDSWDFLLREQYFDKDLKDKIKEIETPPAANATHPFVDFSMDLAYRVMAEGGEDVFHMSRETRNE